MEMEACIARGGISHVLSQARASLKNPSRPYTPRTTGRALFNGDDYRPTSRPSSSYSTTEREEYDSTPLPKSKNSSVGGPSPSSLPPRPIKSKSITKRKETPAAPSTAQVKLMHAPPEEDSSPDVESHDGRLTDTDEDASEKEEDDPLDASLEIPSSESLAAALQGIENQLNDLLRGHPARISLDAIDPLLQAIRSFLSSSAIHTSTSRRSPEARRVGQLRQCLFDLLVEAVVGPWHSSAIGAVALTPSIFELYSPQLGDGKDPADAGHKIVELGKTLFVLSKDSGNDAVLCRIQYIESALLLIAQATSGQQVDMPVKALIYVAGTLKNMSGGDDKALKLLATNGAIAILGNTLVFRCGDSKEVAQFLLQTTAVLRNLATCKAYLKQFNDAEVCGRLCDLCEPPFLQHQELMVNVSRVLGKLTLHETPRAQINQQMERRVGNLIATVEPSVNRPIYLTASSQPTDKQRDAQDQLLVRLFFTLGNLCAGNDRDRQYIGLFHPTATATLLHAVELYGQQYVSATAPSANVVDVLVKLVRLLANVAMNAEVGARLNAAGEKFSVLLTVLEDAMDRQEHEELMLNIVSFLTNLSYYGSMGPSAIPNGFVECHRLVITSLLSKILWGANDEAVLEAARAFGNLTRFQDVLRVLCDTKVLDGFVILLDHSHKEIVYTVCGVLMNAARDNHARRRLLAAEQDVQSGVGQSGVHVDARVLLANIVDCASLDDPEMSCMASKVLCNLLIHTEADRYWATEAGHKLRKTIATILDRISEMDEGEVEDSSEELRGVLLQLQRCIEA